LRIDRHHIFDLQNCLAFMNGVMDFMVGDERATWRTVLL
jgi:hypothetical protein